MLDSGESKGGVPRGEFRARFIMGSSSSISRPGISLGILALLAYWPILDAHPLMDDHLFFAWLEQTSTGEAIRQRLTGNWIPYFNQMQMYRPVSGIVQAVGYQLFGAQPLPHHLLSLLLHCMTSLLSGILAYRLCGDSKAGWCAAVALLLHPRAALGTSLIYNFYDLLCACLMVSALLCLESLRRNGGPDLSLRHCGLWVCTGLALGTKEVTLPFVAVLILADWLWGESGSNVRRLWVRHSVPVSLLMLYLLARWRFAGHPFRTHGHTSAFPLPAGGESWALLWDALLLGTCGLCAVFAYHSRWRVRLPRHSAWMMVWSGLMLWPAVHFCSQVSLRPWFFDERYWYVPLVPLTVLAASLLAKGGLGSAALGAGVLALTLPGSLSALVAASAFVVFGPLGFQQWSREVKQTTGAILSAAVALLLNAECQGIRLRADDAERVRSEISQAVEAAPAESALAFLNFNESTVEQRFPFNGDLQWLLQPPFFETDLNQRLFFAYSTWDSPPTNRFRDRLTADLVAKLDRGARVSVFRWFEREQRLRSEGQATGVGGSGQSFEKLEVTFTEVQYPTGKTRWTSNKLAVDGKKLRFFAFRISLPKEATLQGKEIVFRWKGSGTENRESLQLRFDNELQMPSGGGTEATVWLFPGGTVDWLLESQITELEIETSVASKIRSAWLSSAMPAHDAQRAQHLRHYRNPQTKFEQVGESWWVWQER